MKNTSLQNRDIALFSVLQGYFKSYLNLVRGKFIYLLITALCRIKAINYDRLASGFDTKANKNGFY